jgi:ribonuclease BN (tRNA processing enzyme)
MGRDLGQGRLVEAMPGGKAGMKIRVLGTRGEIDESAPRHSRHSGVLVDGRLMFDLGEREFLDEKPEAVFITHLHPDHAFFVIDPANLTVPVYAPEERGDLPGVKAFPGSMTIGGYKIQGVPVHHSIKVQSLAYVLEKSGQKMLYTGDTVWINKEYHPLFEGLNLVVTEASFLRKGGMVKRDKESGRIFGHNGLPDLVALFSKFTRNILLVHFGSWFYQDIKKSRRAIAAVGAEHGVKIRVGYEGLVFNLAELKR